MSRIHRIFEFTGLTTLAFALAALAVRWYELGPVPPAGDYADHLLKSMSLHYALTSGPLLERAASLLGWRDYYPPLTYAITSLFYGLGGISVAAALASQGLPVFIYLLCLHDFARTAWGRSTAWIVTLLGGTAPLLLFNTRYYFLELSEACWLAAALYCLLRCDGFRNRKFSITLGFAMAAGCLTKWTFLWFALPPLAWCGLTSLPRGLPGIAEALRLLVYPLILVLSFLVMKARYFLNFEGPVRPVPGMCFQLYLLFFAIAVVLFLLVRRRPRDPAANFLVSLLPPLALAWPWYLQNLDLMLEKMGTHGRTYPAAQNLSFSAMQHMTTMRDDLIFCLPFLLIAGLAFIIADRDYRKILLPALLGLAAGAAITIIFMPMGNRYSLPALPFFALLCLGWVHRLRHARWALVAVVVLLSMWQLFGWVVFRSTGLAERIGHYRISPRLPHSLGFIPAAVENHLFSTAVSLPSGKDFGLEEVVQEAGRLAGGRPAKFAVLSPDIGIIKEETFAYYAMARGLPLFFFRVMKGDRRSYGDILSVRRYEHILRRSGRLAERNLDDVPEAGFIMMYRSPVEKEDLETLASLTLPPGGAVEKERSLPEGLTLEIRRLGGDP